MGVHGDFWKRRKAQLVDEGCAAEKRGDTEGLLVALRAIRGVELQRLERIRAERAPVDAKAVTR